jgi:hypothetical protein
VSAAVEDVVAEPADGKCSHPCLIEQVLVEGDRHGVTELA